MSAPAWIYTDLLLYAPTWWLLTWVTIRITVRVVDSRMHAAARSHERTYSYP